MRTGSAQFWTDWTDRTSHTTEEGPDGLLVGGDASLSEAAASAAPTVEGVVHMLHELPQVRSRMDDGVLIPLPLSGEYGAPPAAGMAHGVT